VVCLAWLSMICKEFRQLPMKLDFTITTKCYFANRCSQRFIHSLNVSYSDTEGPIFETPLLGIESKMLVGRASMMEKSVVVAGRNTDIVFCGGGLL